MRWVVKIGSNSLTDENGSISQDKILFLIEDIVHLRHEGVDVVLVSSGAIAYGRALLGKGSKPLTLPEKQALAALGQPHLLAHYRDTADHFGLKVAQLLLTRSDFDRRERYVRIRQTTDVLLAEQVLPIVNENDTVSVAEIRFGDNDILSALLAINIEADRLIILTDIDGLYDAPPLKVPGAKKIERVETWDDALLLKASDRGSVLGTGGMQSKLNAARLATEAGIETWVMRFERGSLERHFRGEHTGTQFVAAPRSLSPKKRWLSKISRPLGTIWVDDGAREALLDKHKSLLFPGIVRLEGHFEAHDTVRVVDLKNDEIGRGIALVSAVDLTLLLERRQRGEAVPPVKEIIHRDGWVTTAAQPSSNSSF
ncbi:MAG: glutamate 5-kinase [Candidatus Carbobacillus altaicus]|uniref:Glutamate 5-kinase n=1 Tax=Candidatus Carbonibacillus altaicus TaxID=2163959 RepID=A0A2R6Y3J5_9BACL|nr:glutamate 5-kinase [Candidatus Carbobacillus altaicus]PTQ57256.1 MAG: Glutamate 5-kinase [Candidatus Carbobacillus altaicus]